MSLSVDHRAVARVDRGDLAALGVQDRGALAQRRRLEIGRESRRIPRPMPLAASPSAPAAGSAMPGQHGSGEHADTEELGGLLGRATDRRPSASLPWGQPTFSFAGHAYRPWPKLLSTVTAVRLRINPSATPDSFTPAILVERVSESASCVIRASVVTQRELSRFAGIVAYVAQLTPLGDLPRTHSPFGPFKIGPEGGVALCPPSVTSSTGGGEYAAAAVGEPRFGRGRRRYGLGNRLECAGSLPHYRSG